MREDLVLRFKVLLEHLEVAKMEDFVPDDYSGLYVGYGIDDMTCEIVKEIKKQINKSK